MNLIDLAAILPFWVILLVKTANPNSNASGSFGFVRVIRLVRVFRVFKFGRYSIGLQMFAGALKGSVQPMGILVFVMSINMIIVSSVVHIVELAIPDEDQSEAHLRCFGTIARTFWWSMVTMTTVGYGDCSPLSPLGKVFAVVAMLSGVLILALPITVIGSNFAKMVEMFEDVRACLARLARLARLGLRGLRHTPRTTHPHTTHHTTPHTTHHPRPTPHTPSHTHTTHLTAGSWILGATPHHIHARARARTTPRIPTHIRAHLDGYVIRSSVLTQLLTGCRMRPCTR